MTKNFVDDRTTLNDMDVQGDIDAWTATNFDAMTLNDDSQPTVHYREGSGGGEMVAKASTDGYWVDDITLDLTGGIGGSTKIFVMWLWVAGPQDMGRFTDFFVGLYDVSGGQGGSSPDGGRWDYKSIIETADIYGWIAAIVYPTQPDETTGTFGNMSLSGINSMELSGDQSTGSDIKLLGMEACFSISYIGGYATVGAETITLTDLVGHSKDKTNDRDFGVAYQLGDAYRFRVAIRLNDAAAGAAVTMDETAKVIHFDNFNSDHEIGFHFIADAQNVDFRLTDCFLFWNDGASDVFTGVANVNDWDLVGNTFLRSGPIELPADSTGRKTNENKFDACGEIDIGDAIFEDNTVKNATSGVLYTGTGTRKAKNNTYVNCTDGLHFDTAQTITLDGDKFSGNTDDIHFSGTGTLTINTVNGANPVSSRVSGGGTVVINTTNTYTIAGIVAGTEVRVCRQSDNVELDGTESSGTSFVYTHNGTDVAIWIILINNSYKYRKTADSTGSAINKTVQANQELDPNYSNP